MLLENSGILNQISNRKNKQSSDHYESESPETLLEEVNEKRVSMALKKTSEILQDIDCLLSNSKKWKTELLYTLRMLFQMTSIKLLVSQEIIYILLLCDDYMKNDI